MSPLARGRGLKHPAAHWETQVRSVAPRAGADPFGLKPSGKSGVVSIHQIANEAAIAYLLNIHKRIICIAYRISGE
jgi:hypothetical protein